MQIRVNRNKLECSLPYHFPIIFFYIYIDLNIALPMEMMAFNVGNRNIGFFQLLRENDAALLLVVVKKKDA